MVDVADVETVDVREVELLEIELVEVELLLVVREDVVEVVEDKVEKVVVLVARSWGSRMPYLLFKPKLPSKGSRVGGSRA